MDNRLQDKDQRPLAHPCWEVPSEAASTTKTILRGIEICHPKMCSLGRKIILSWRLMIRDAEGCLLGLLLCDQKQKLLRNEGCHESASQGSFMVVKEMESEHQEVTDDLYLPLVSPNIYFLLI